MHYGSYDFSINDERTIITKDEKYQDLIGNRATFTASDMNYVNLLYSYTEDDLDPGCNCNEIEITGFQLQSWINGYYNVNDSLFNDRNSFSNGASQIFNYNGSIKILKKDGGVLIITANKGHFSSTHTVMDQFTI